MKKLDLASMEKILWEVFKDKKSTLSKKDVDRCALLPSYNTCCRWGLRLHKINGPFSESLYRIDPKKCKLCSSKLPYDKRTNEFCDSSCAATFNEIGKLRKRQAENATTLSNKRKYKILQTSGNVKPTIVITTDCLNCCKEIPSDRPKYSKYCSDICKKAYNFESRFRDWYEFGKHFENKSIRTFLTAWKGYRCEHCGISEWNGKPITLEVEHIDGNSDNSSPENVCLLCPNCHSQTPTYKVRNKGNGRHYRKIRYSEGKSY